MRMMGPRRTAPSRQKVSFMPPDAAQPSANQNPDPPKDKMDAMASAAVPPEPPPPPAPKPRYNAYMDAVNRHENAMKRIDKAKADAEKKNQP